MAKGCVSYSARTWLLSLLVTTALIDIGCAEEIVEGLETWTDEATTTDEEYVMPSAERERRSVCKCVCRKDIPVCKSVPGEECLRQCEEQCEAGEHTVDDSGRCRVESNCTCIQQYDDNPVCARDIYTSMETTFLNLRVLHCHNVCKFYDHVLVAKGNCYDLPGRRVDVRN